MFADFPAESMIKGPSVHTLSLIEGFKDCDDIELRIVDFKSERGESRNLTIAQNISVSIVPIRWPLTFYNIATRYGQYVKEIREFQPDIVHFTDPHQVNAMRFCGHIPHVLTIHGHFFNEHGLVSESLKRKLTRKAYFNESFRGLKLAANIILLSEYSKNEVAPYITGRTFNLGQPIPSDVFEIARTQSSPVVLCVGNVAKIKGQDRLVEVHSEFPEGTETRIAGAIRDPGYVAQLKEVIKNKKIVGLTFLGGLERDAIFKQLSQARILVCPSRLENMPYAILEACAVGIPCVSYNVGGINEVIKSGENGFVVDNQDEFVAAVNTLLIDETVYAEMSIKAKNSVQALKPDLVCRELKSIYQQILTL
ncbi:hypothetical protein GCM10009114_18750 [Aliiglaciecola litoralis]|uniref:Uncharacterized protein n=2 Tax=Aliiglaciecola litoralis TaxID=582857 RepID=A0ABP3WTI0_9ALTE